MKKQIFTRLFRLISIFIIKKPYSIYLKQRLIKYFDSKINIEFHQDNLNPEWVKSAFSLLIDRYNHCAQ